MRHRPGERGQRCRAAGFTLVELLVVVVMAGLLGGTTLNLFRMQNAAFGSESHSVEMAQNLRGGLDLMTRELRNAGMRDGLLVYEDPPGISLADSVQVRFEQDFHGRAESDAPDGDMLDANEDIEYSYTPGDRTLRRRTRGAAGDSGAQPLAELVSTVRFTYFDAAGGEIDSPVAAGARPGIRRIHVRLEATAADGRSAAALECDVVPRNLAFPGAGRT